MNNSTFENYDSKGLKLRSCSRMRQAHRAHTWSDPELGQVHCWGKNPLPEDAEEKYCTVGCDCVHCTDIRNGFHPRTIMCDKKWSQLPAEIRVQITESVAG